MNAIQTINKLNKRNIADNLSHSRKLFAEQNSPNVLYTPISFIVGLDE